MKANKKIVVLGGGFVFLLAMLAAVWYFNRPAAEEGGKTITVEVVHKDESTKTFTYHTDAEYLAGVLVGEGLVVDNQTEYGLMMEEVDGEKAIYEEDQSYWAIYQNGEYAQLGASRLPIFDGDEISLVYTVYSGG